MGDNRIAVFETSMGTFRAELYCTQMPITCGNFIDLVQSGFYNGLYFHRVIPDFMNQFGCPNTRGAPYADTAGTGGPDPNTTFASAMDPNQIYTRTEEGGIPDELTQRISNSVGTLSMANTGAPESGGSQFFINVASTYLYIFIYLFFRSFSYKRTSHMPFHIGPKYETTDNSFLDWFDRGTESAHPVFGKVTENYALAEQISRVPTNEGDCPSTPIQMIRVTIE